MRIHKVWIEITQLLVDEFDRYFCLIRLGPQEPGMEVKRTWVFGHFFLLYRALQ